MRGSWTFVTVWISAQNTAYADLNSWEVARCFCSTILCSVQVQYCRAAAGTASHMLSTFIDCHFWTAEHSMDKIQAVTAIVSYTVTL